MRSSDKRSRLNTVARCDLNLFLYDYDYILNWATGSSVKRVIVFIAELEGYNLFLKLFSENKECLVRKCSDWILCN